MTAALKYVFVAVAVICYMQAVQMARLPRDTGDAPAQPSNIFENIGKPEFWNSLSQNFTSLLSEDNLKQLGLKPESIKDAINTIASDVQKNFGELSKSLQGIAEQQLANKPQKTN